MRGKAQAELGWQAQRGLDQMMLDTWRWQVPTRTATAGSHPLGALCFFGGT